LHHLIHLGVTRFTEPTISLRVSPDRFTSSEPASTFPRLSSISPLISFAAVALRCARFLTSAATTENPRPCFSARRFVWNAISSIVVMMSAIFFEARLISCMALTAAVTTCPPFSAASRDPTASWLACFALSAFCLADPVISSSDAAVSSRLDACSWAPEDSCSDPAASCCEAAAA
jgi:hypothetical protein